jgi:membrane protein DedA with SNARE-associated domain
MSVELISPQMVEKFAQTYGYWTVLFGIMLENTGLPLPGETIVVISGFLAGGGQMNYWWVLLAAITGAIIGDNFGYWIGYYGGWPLVQRLSKFFRIPEVKLLDLRQRFSYNAPRAVFLGRFIAILRIFAGPMAGIAQMPYRKFLICNAAGAVVWASITITVAYFAGQVIPLERLLDLMSQFGIVVFALVVLWIVVPPLLERGKSHSAPVGKGLEPVNELEAESEAKVPFVVSQPQELKS